MILFFVDNEQPLPQIPHHSPPDFEKWGFDFWLCYAVFDTFSPLSPLSPPVFTLREGIFIFILFQKQFIFLYIYI